MFKLGDLVLRFGGDKKGDFSRNWRRKNASIVHYRGLWSPNTCVDCGFISNQKIRHKRLGTIETSKWLFLTIFKKFL